MKLGATDLTALYLGSTAITKAYLGATEVFALQTGPDLSTLTAIPEVEGIFVADPDYLYTDAGVTNVTADGDAVQEWHCAAGSGAVLSLTGSGVTYQDDGTHRWVESNGSGRLSGAAPDTWQPPQVLAAALRQTTTEFFRAFGIGNPNVDDQLNLIASHATEPNLGILCFDQNGVSWSSDAGLAAQNTDFVVSAELSGGSAAARINGGADRPATSNLHGGNSADRLLAFAREDSGTNSNHPGRLYAAVVTVGVPSAADRTAIDQWLAGRCGVTI